MKTHIARTTFQHVHVELCTKPYVYTRVANAVKTSETTHAERCRDGSAKKHRNKVQHAGKSRG